MNVASRLEGANKELGTTICVSDAIRLAAAGLMCRPLRRLQVKGRTEPLLVHEALGVEDSADPELSPPDGAAARVACGRDTLAALDAGSLGEARERLAEHLRRDPGDRAALALQGWLTRKLEPAQRIQ